jgi:hypothetical protein
MVGKQLLSIPFAASLLASGGAAAAPDPTPDLAATAFFLEQDCGPAGSEQQNCFETTGSLQLHIQEIRASDPITPLLVKIGGGTFDGLQCFGWGHATFIGSGRKATTLVGLYAAAVFFNCTEIEFQDMTLGPNLVSVAWRGGGTSVWTNVDLIGRRSAWYDECDDPTPIGEHFFFGSRMLAQPQGPEFLGDDPDVTVFYSDCGLSWIYGSEIAIVPRSDNLPPNVKQWQGVNVNRRGDVRLFGSSIRMKTAPVSANADGSNVQGVVVGDRAFLPFGVGGTETADGSFHMHGGIISVDASSLPSASAFGIRLKEGGTALAHTPGTAHSILPSATGSAARLDGFALSPFLWQAGPRPPFAATEANVISSEDGQDLFVETDCSPGGDCSGSASDPEPHLMIYAEGKCGTANPWFDVVTAACRQ